MTWTTDLATERCEGCTTGLDNPTTHEIDCRWTLNYERQLEAAPAYADLDGTREHARLLAEDPDFEACYFCLNEATTDAPIGPDRNVRVCGLHS